MFTAEEYGAVGDGVADDTAPIQAALDAALAVGGGEVRLRERTYKITAGLTVGSTGVDGVRVVGTGVAGTTVTAPAGIAAFTLTGKWSILDGIKITCTDPAPASGAGVKINANAQLCTLRDLAVSGFYDNIDHESGTSSTLDNLYIINAHRYGIRVRNTSNPDAGDHHLANLSIDTAHPAAAAVRIESSGGCKLSNVKVTNHAYGLDLQVADGVATSVLTVTGCSFELNTAACIRLGRSGTTGTYSEITITGNQLNGGPTGQGVVIGAGCSMVTIVANTLKGAADRTAISLNGGEKHVVTGNAFITWAKAVSIAVGVPRGSVFANEYGDVALPVENLTNRNQPSPGVVDRTHRRLISTTSDTTYTNLWKIDLGSYRAAQVELVFEGLAGGAGVFARTITKMLHRSSAGVSVVAVADVAAGTGFDVQFDTATTSGSVIVGLKRSTGVGTDLSGNVTMRLSGGVQAVSNV